MALKIPIKRRHWREPSWLLPAGLRVIPLGRRSILCEQGIHKWQTELVFSVPYLRCSRCGFRAPKPTLEHTATKQELRERIQKAMAKEQPILPAHPVSQDELRKAREKLILKAWLRYQEYKRTKRGTLKYVGDRR